MLQSIDFEDIIANRPLCIISIINLISFFTFNLILKDCAHKIGLVTANTLITNTYVWNLVTSCFYENSFFKLFFNIIAVFFATKSLPIPNYEQFCLYLIFSILACTIGTSVYCFVGFYVMENEKLLITPIYGFNGVLVTILMYSRQLYRNDIVHPSIPYVTFNNLPIVLVLAQLLMKVLPMFKFFTRDILFSMISLIFSWSYLRFYYKFNTNSDELGEKSDDFSFVAMFPKELHIVLIPFTTTFYNILALIGLYPPLEFTEKKTYHHLRSNMDSNKSSYELESNNLEESNAQTLNLDIVAERRRAKALKLLDAKMAQLSNEPEGWDDVGGVSNESISPELEYNSVKLKV